MTTAEALAVKRRKLEAAIESSSDSEPEDTETPGKPAPAVDDLYLETVNRARLDFDFEKTCSISLSSVNVYCCLVCGKYLQGRGRTSHAFAHALAENHHIFVNLATLRFYVLPEGYEVQDTSGLADIKQQIDPLYTEADVRRLYKRTEMSQGLNAEQYRAGFVGMNNTNNVGDFANVVVQALAHVTALRDFLLLDTCRGRSALLEQLSLVVRKLWSSGLFKPHISPHALLQVIYRTSADKFSPSHKSDPRTLLLWLLNTLAADLQVAPGKKTVVHRIFQGRAATPEGRTTKFWLLSLDLPHHSMLKEGEGSQEVPQVAMGSLLAQKFARRIVSAPPVLVVHFNRFKDADMKLSSVSGSARNPTVVTFPLQMDMAPYIKDAAGPVRYRLVCNVVHELVPLASLENGDRDASNWKVQLLDKARDEWVVVHDLSVEPAERELMFLEESYLQFWERM